jgi:hypothetical protein
LEHFWSLTPRELYWYCDGHKKRQEHEAQGRAWLAWHIAALGRAKHLPSLAKIMPKPDHHRKTLARDLKRALRAYNATKTPVNG